MSFAYKRKVTCGLATSSAKTDFPLLVRFDSSNCGTTMKTVANGGHINNTVTQANGGCPVTMPADLIFTSDLAGTTKIPWEVDFYDGTNGVLLVWVLISSLSASSNSAIYVHYGDAAVTTQQSSGGTAPSAVWVNGKFVYHASDGTTLNFADSSATVSDGTNSGATATSGQIDGTAQFLGSGSQFISWGSPAALRITNNITLSCWLNTPLGSSSKPSLLNQYSADSPYGIGIYPTNGGLDVFVGDGDATKTDCSFTATGLGDGNWHFLVVTFSSGTVEAFLDGSSLGTSAAGFSAIGYRSGDLLQIGSDGTDYLTGSIAEARVMDAARSSSWIATEYSNQNSPLTFNTIGGENAQGGWLQGNYWWDNC